MMGKPKIRFKGYNEDWEQRKLGEYVEITSGEAPAKFQEGDINYVKVDDLNYAYKTVINTQNKVLKNSSVKMVQAGSVIFPKRGAAILTNKVRVLGVDSYMDTNMMALSSEKLDTNFLYTMLSKEGLYKIADTSTIPQINNKHIEPYKIYLPGMDEQLKIGIYFSNLDNLITLHQRKIYIFIKKMPIDWEQRKLNEIADRVSEKNKNNEFSEPFTNSAEQGIISQRDYFDREIVNNENLNGYYIVRNDDFIYNPRISVTAPVGPINRNRLGRNGVMSPLYTVFRTHDINNLYLEFYFKTTKWHRFMKLNGDSGARFDRFTISSTQFMEMPIPYPMLDEQIKIGEYFDTLDHLITLHHRKCVVLRKMKVSDWEQRKLGEIATYRNGKAHEANQLDVGTYELVNLNSISIDGGLKPSGKFIEDGGDTLQRNDLVMVLSDVGHGDLLGRVAIIPENNRYVLNQRVALLRINDDTNTYFLFSIINRYQDYFKKLGAGSSQLNISRGIVENFEVTYPNVAEQRMIADYFHSLDHLITLHHRECVILRKMKVNDWEQRKLGSLLNETRKKTKVEDEDTLLSCAIDGMYLNSELFSHFRGSSNIGYLKVKKNDLILSAQNLHLGNCNVNLRFEHGIISPAYKVYELVDCDPLFMQVWVKQDSTKNFFLKASTEGASVCRKNIVWDELYKQTLPIPKLNEQEKIGQYFDTLDHHITLHHHEEFCTENVLIYIEINITIQIKEDIMAELESVIEQKLIDQLVYGDSQWTYRADLKTEEDLWNNFRYILEQNNKDRLNGEPLSDTEFEQVKNQLQFSSFYKAGEWLVGENGKVMVHVQRDTERLHLVVMNHEHIAGGSSVYEVINQYRALADEESQTKAQDRRFDVTLMINGLPMIHIELKNKQHSYMDGFWQIKKYIGEGKFTGIFSAVQMFVISNGVDTKYFSAASDTELNPKFISGWLDNENNPVPDYLDFAKSVLRIPEAHEMIARYTVLDEEAKRLILLRPYQIHAIEAIREASKTGKSGFVWHTTGSGKTLTSYKATRNLLMDIPSIDKAIFLIDRKDLDTQTSMAFRTYANNDLVDVDQTDNVFDLKKKLKSDDRQMIVTTIQKLQRLITKKLAEGTPEYNKIKNLKIAFVVDECHRAVTPGTKRELERFFANSLWYGFTGTPRFAENPYPQLGDLPRTTEELYGERLHRYTIQNAIHDNAVLGFQVEHNGPKNMDDETDSSMYENETHMLRVLDVILNKSYHKLGFQNGKGKTYEGLLTTSSIQLAQKYYELLKRVKNGETELQIDEKVKQILPDFPKFAITYSVTENEEGSHLNQEKMKESIKDYNEMFGTKLDISQIQSYNANLNKRLARKEPKFQSRSEQLDLVIVVDRLLTGFDAPCMSTLFVDRQPMGPHDLIQAFSRTNRIFDKNKTYGQIVTFQAPKLFKECVDNAVKLYSAGSTEIALLAEWEEIEPAFRKALKALRVSAETPAEIPAMSEKEKVLFVKAFQNFDKLFAQLKSFTQYEDSMLTEYGISEDEYDDYAGHYLNVKEELKAGAEDTQSEMEEQPIDVDYELMAYSNTKIDYEYIINLIQNIVTPDEDVEMTPEERQKQLEEVKQYIDDLRKENPKVADIMSTLVSEIEQDEVKYKGQSILNIVENMKHECIEKVVMDFSITWYVSKDDVMYAATHYRNGEIPNESAIKSTADFTSFKEAQERAIPKFKYYNMMIEELRKTLEEEIKPLLNN